jgi:hypothetical protein
MKTLRNLIATHDELKEKLNSLVAAINSLQGHRHSIFNLQDAQKDDRYAVKLLVDEYVKCNALLQNLLDMKYYSIDEPRQV